MAKSVNTELCECGMRAKLSCCRRYLEGTDTPTLAEELMRSRYTAYVNRDTAYVLRTWHASTRPPELDLSDDLSTKWLGLTVKHAVQQGDQATVEFVARYKVGGGPAVRMQEVSRFVREEGQWFYVDGVVTQA